MRCVICDWDITISFLKKFPDEDYCEHCELSILNAIREQNEDSEEEGEKDDEEDMDRGMGIEDVMG